MLRWLCNPRRNQVAPVSSSMIAERNYIVIQRYFLRKISQIRRLWLSVQLHQTMLVTVPLALADAGALVVLLLSFGEGDLEFCPAFFPIKR